MTETEVAVFYNLRSFALFLHRFPSISVAGHQTRGCSYHMCLSGNRLDRAANQPCLPYPWSSLVEGDEGSFLPNCQSNLVIVIDALSLLFSIFINTTAYHCEDTSLKSPICSHAPRTTKEFLL